jgi:hypothetical protein
MPEYICKSCEYKTNKKNNYDKHLKTTKHLENINKSNEDNCSVSSVSSSVSKQSIIDYEYQLKMKDLEIQNIINEYTLKLQLKETELKHKDEIIYLLQQQLQNKPIIQLCYYTDRKEK